MRVLPERKDKKPAARRRADITSALALLLTIAMLAICAFSVGTADGSVTASGSAIYKAPTEEKVACLMFNVYEGAENVKKILSILDTYGARATFFIGGIWAERNAETLLEIAMAGHEIGSHGYLHKDHAAMTYSQNKEEIAISASLIANITGVRIKLFAPPSGAFNEDTERVCRDLGLKLVLWTKDTIDWRDSDVPLLVKRATKNISRGDLILMHPKSHTVSALPEIIEAYKKEGYRLVSVSEATA